VRGKELTLHVVSTQKASFYRSTKKLPSLTSVQIKSSFKLNDARFSSETGSAFARDFAPLASAARDNLLKCSELSSGFSHFKQVSGKAGFCEGGRSSAQCLAASTRGTKLLTAFAVCCC
jgi:hypothetical protein